MVYPENRLSKIEDTFVFPLLDVLEVGGLNLPNGIAVWFTLPQ